MDLQLRARVLLAEADSLGLTIDDLVAAASTTTDATRNPAPTVRDYIAIVEPTLSPGTASTYRSYWRLAETRYGDRPIDTIDLAKWEVVITDAVARAQRRRPGSDGRSSKENCIGALRALLGHAERARVITWNPAAELEKPRRLPNRRRALDDDELTETVDAVRQTSRDPELDLLLVRFHLESGARREGALNLTLGNLDQRRSTIWLREKFGIEREQPISPTLLKAIVDHAASRRATQPTDPVFRTKRLRPITRRHYNTLFDRAQAVIPWALRTPVTAHVLRHTAITAVERHAGYAVAQAFAGHATTSVTGTYAKAHVHEVATAISDLTGEAHPLARRSAI